MKKAFTLIELIVVVGILAILMGSLVAVVSRGTDAARAVRCLTNLKNLATACNSYAMANGHYPLAGSVELRAIDRDENSAGEVKRRFYEERGWISWSSRGAYEGKVSSHVASKDWFTSAYDTDFDVRQYAVTNGALWKYISENSDVFVCPEHSKKTRPIKPLWSYVMNERFGYDDSLGSRAKLYSPHVGYGRLSRPADRVLMFAELLFVEGLGDVDFSASPGTEHDCTLQYTSKGGNEIVGFNHSAGKAGRCAHVVFADAHTEKIMMPKGGMTIDDARNLTKFLCEGTDYTLENGRFKEL